MRASTDEVIQDTHDVANVLLDMEPVGAAAIVQVHELDIEMDPTPTNEDILRVQIAVILAFLVQRREPSSDRTDHRQRFVRGHPSPSILIEQVTQDHPVHKLRDEHTYGLSF